MEDETRESDMYDVKCSSECERQRERQRDRERDTHTDRERRACGLWLPCE